MDPCRSKEKKGPLWKYADSEKSESEICKGCKFFPTNAEAVPDEIAEPVGTALDLSRRKRGGARFDYPNGLSPFEWASLDGLTAGQDRAENLKQERDRLKARRKKPSK